MGTRNRFLAVASGPPMRSKESPFKEGMENDGRAHGEPMPVQPSCPDTIPVGTLEPLAHPKFRAQP